MEDAILQTLTDYGALGLFAGYLAWQQNKLQQALQKQIDTLQERHEQREDAMRARYDTVIADLNRHRDSMSSEMTAALTRSADKLEDLENQIREMRIALK